MGNIDFKEMKQWMEQQTEEDWQRMREEHEKKIQQIKELAKTHPEVILADDRRRDDRRRKNNK